MIPKFPCCAVTAGFLKRMAAQQEEALGSEMEELLGPGNILEAEIITKSNGRSKSEAAPEPNPQLSTSKDLFTVTQPHLSLLPSTSASSTSAAPCLTRNDPGPLEL